MEQTQKKRCLSTIVTDTILPQAKRNVHGQDMFQAEPQNLYGVTTPTPTTWLSCVISL